MKNLYLYRLFKHSKWAGVGLIIYLLLTIWLSNKKMDWIMFPRNDMFSGQAIIPIEYVPRLYVNNKPVRTSDMLYWKRDFLEQSLQLYVNATEQKQLYQLDWLKRKTESHTWLNLFEKSITPCPSNIEWYANMAGIHIEPNDNVEIRIERIDSNFIQQNLKFHP